MSSENTSPNPYASPENGSDAAALALPDRSTGLMLFGIFQVLLGCLCGLMGLMMAVVAVLGPMPGAPQGAAADARSVIPAAVIYLVLGVLFVCLGVGSIRARRWAWTLTVVLSWMWLVMGVISLLGFLLFAGSMMTSAMSQQANVPPEVLLVIRVMTGVILACIYILLPGVFLIFYQRESVRGTCLRRDPQPRWTDRCSMPVLALSLLMAFSAVSMSWTLVYGPVMPLCGSYVTGGAGAAVILLMTLAMAYFAWGAYRLQMAAWWGMLLFCILGSANMVVTFSRTGLMEMYEKAQIPEASLQMIKKSGMIETMSPWLPWMGIAGGLAWLGYLLYVRRYFLRNAQTVD